MKISTRIRTTVILIRNLIILVLIGVFSKSLISIYHLFVPHRMESFTETLIWVAVVMFSVGIAVPVANILMKWLLIREESIKSNKQQENNSE
ncbi:hypothetical protein [Paenibacillus sp. N3.4]|uniref:hypothetical protein n=1 Tax=Paenibacillus sp. N3.4 TaxID=2603222 RepID=UPI0011CB5E06|nr:hypothetical protein [Paenibacillus sp. N3.4]TXK85764.1 hypothetical protein FU659_02330 [Paenibacillus sp. N3.4]